MGDNEPKEYELIKIFENTPDEELSEQIKILEYEEWVLKALISGVIDYDTAKANMAETNNLNYSGRYPKIINNLNLLKRDWVKEIIQCININDGDDIRYTYDNYDRFYDTYIECVEFKIDSDKLILDDIKSNTLDDFKNTLENDIKHCKVLKRLHDLKKLTENDITLFNERYSC
jgi:hypothetical protein